MPIFNFLVVAAFALIALLFVTDATLEPGSPPIVTSNRYGLPNPRPPNPIQIRTTAPAPAPDMTSPLVRDAQPPEALVKIDPAARAARAEAPPKKRDTQPPTDYRPNYQPNHASPREFGPREFGLSGL